MKLLTKRDYLLLGLALAGDLLAELVGRGRAARRYGNIFLLFAGEYKRTNFTALVARLLRTGFIEKSLDRKGNMIIRLGPAGQSYLVREFPLERLRLKWDGRWTVVIFDVPENERWIRDKLRFDLESLGFGMLQKSVWISPFPIAEDLREYLVETGVGGQALVMVGPWLLAGEPKELASKVFRLDKINEEYGELLIEWGGSQKQEANAKNFISKYLQVLATDPFLPVNLLPEDWLGEEVREIFKSLVRQGRGKN